MPQQTQVTRLRLGDILLRARLITRDQLQEALAAQQAGGGRLGEILMEQGFLAEVDLARSLALQLGLPFVAGPDLDVDPAVARLVSEEVAERYGLLPLRQDGPAIRVAVTDPLHDQALEHVRLLTGRAVRPEVVTRATLRRAIVRVFGIPESTEPDKTALPVYAVGEASDNVIIRLANTLVAGAVAARATDLHVEPVEDRVRVRYRVDGVLLEQNPLPLNVHAPLISRLKVMAGMDIAERRLPQDGQIQIDDKGRRLDLRVSTVPTIHGERLAVRLLDRGGGIRTLERLGMPPNLEAAYRDLVASPNGIILITGPTGSGKSTTLAATLSALSSPEKHIITIEDPVEYHLSGVSQVQVNPKAGLTFAGGLRAFLRHDPDVIMVGEVRDGETAETATRAALTGHLVFSTLHTNHASAAPGRLADMGVEPYLLASSLLGVVAQRLVRVLCERCKEPVEIPAGAPERFLPGVPEGPLRVCRARGCGFCDQNGYRGQKAIFELLRVGNRVRELIMARAPAGTIRDQAVAAGMKTLWQAGIDQVRAGVTSLDEVRRVALAVAETE